jgi:HK97 gp10 family phage protein
MVSSFKALGLRLASDKTLKLGQRVESIQRTLLRNVAQQIVGEAVPLAPVRTGFLQSSIDIHGEGTGYVEVGASAEYAGFVEFGTSRMVARPFLRPVVEEKSREFPDLFIHKSWENL